jgi:hypothetical protein
LTVSQRRSKVDDQYSRTLLKINQLLQRFHRGSAVSVVVNSSPALSVALQARSWMVMEKPKLPGDARFRSNNRDRRFESILIRQ